MTDTNVECPATVEPGLELLTARDLGRRLGVTTRTIWRWAADGTIPAPVRVRPRRTRWRTRDIERFLESLPPA